MLRFATENDLRFLIKARNDSESATQTQAQSGQLRAIVSDGHPVGFFKFLILWDKQPYIEMIWIEEAARRQGLGTQAVRDWEREMASEGFDIVLTSTQLEGGAEPFWKKLGYSRCGSLSVGDTPQEQFLQHRLA